jgi:phosphate uptake regulator
VISDDEKLDSIQHDLEARAINLMARQQPVAQDLRILVTSLRMSADLERMGDLCHHIAKLARMRYPEVAVPAELVKTIENMGTTAVKIIEKSTHVVKTQDLQAAIELETDDDEMDKLHRALFVALLDDSWSHGIEAAITTSAVQTTPFRLLVASTSLLKVSTHQRAKQRSNSRSNFYFLPWLATALIASAAAAGSKYFPPLTTGVRSVLSS